MTMPSEKPLGLNHASGENRRASKPLIEKRRRARINQSLAALKAIVVDSRKDTQSQNTRQPKLEKADILEMTVTHLKKLHECMEPFQASGKEGGSYKAGFFKCIQTIREFIENENTLSFEQKTRLLSHICTATPSSLQASEQIGAQMDDTASSYSGSSRSNTPSSAINDLASMELPYSPPLSDNIHEGSSNSSSPPSATRTKFYKNHSSEPFPSTYVCNKQSSRFQSNNFPASGTRQMEQDPVLYMNRPLNLASGSRDIERNEGFYAQNISTRNNNGTLEAAPKANNEAHQFFDNRFVVNDSLMQMDPVWRPW